MGHASQSIEHHQGRLRVDSPPPELFEHLDGHVTGALFVGEGETLVIPPDVSHGVVALEDTVVFDVFAPSRDDWPR